MSVMSLPPGFRCAQGSLARSGKPHRAQSAGADSYKLFALAIIILLTAVCTSTPALGQIGSYKNFYVAITGNSIAQFQAPFALQEFPAIPSLNVKIWGMDGATCSGVLPLILHLVPGNTNVAVLIDSTNDIANGVPVAQHMSCIEQTIALLLGRNPALRIVVANTPPWTQYNPCTATYRDYSVVEAIEAYNAAYADPSSGLQALFPNNVRVADVFTPAAYADGWAIPQYMSGPCGIHPGQEYQWSASWAHFAQPYQVLVMSAVQGRW